MYKPLAQYNVHIYVAGPLEILQLKIHKGQNRAQ